MKDLTIGMKYRLDQIVQEDDLATIYGSGGLPVFATPGMIALMEGAACMLSKQEPYNIDTVGIDVHVQHTAATKLGDKVWAEATLTKTDGKRLYFDLVAYSEKGEIGKGEHIRYIIDPVKFMENI